MAERASESLQQQIENRLRYYEDLGIRLFYRDRTAAVADVRPAQSISNAVPISAPLESSLPKSIAKPFPPKAVAVAPIAAPSAPSLFESVNKIKDDTLLKIREDMAIARAASFTRAATKLYLEMATPKPNLCLSAKGRARMKTRRGSRLSGARENF